ncbi:MAG: hypothetical protein F6K44_06480 [Moorea sp. SIO3E2]|nr:hypothetical protein [Moorena sp. SIO3E2]
MPKHSAVSRQPSAKGSRYLRCFLAKALALAFRPRVRVWPRCANDPGTSLSIIPMLTCCLDPKREWGKPWQTASGGNPLWRHCLPKTVMVRLQSSN